MRLPNNLITRSQQTLMLSKTSEFYPSIFLTVYPIHCGGGLLEHKSWKRTQTLISGFPVYLEKRQQVEFARSGWMVGDRQQEVTPRFI